MITTARTFTRRLLACALIVAASVSAQAATIVKLNLGSIGPDISMNGAGILSTMNDGDAATTGDQNTDIEWVGGLDLLPDNVTGNASFTLQGLAATGPANVFGSLVIQNFFGGQFSLYDSNVSHTLLLQGPLTNSAVTGVIGPPGTGALFTTTLTSVTGGSLAPLVLPGTVSLSMNLSNVNGGLGFSVSGVGPQLTPFLADASMNISGEVPEPATLGLLSLGTAAAIGFARRRR